MSGIKKVEELVCSPEFAGLYDIEERRQRDILDSKLTGLREGKEEGIQERNIEIANNLLKLNTVSIEDISKVTGLTIEEINNLKS